MTSKETKKRPVHTRRCGKIQSAVFEHEKQDHDGNTYVQQSIGIQKSTKDPTTGEWRNEGFFIEPKEAPDVAELCGDAYRFCRLKDGNAETSE